MTTLFQSLTYRDASAAAEFLKALGFEQRAWYPNADDPTVIEHAQFSWRDDGGVMLGSSGRRPADSPLADHPGMGVSYLVVGTDEEVDDVYRRGLAAGGTSIQAPLDQDYGGRSASIADPEGNQWSIGSYPGE